MEIIIGISLLTGLMYIIGWALKHDLKEIEKNEPRYRKHLKHKFKI